MISFVISTVVNTVVWLVAMSHRENPLARTLAWFVVCLALWQAELFLLKNLQNPDDAQFWFVTTRIGMFFMPYFIARLSWSMTGGDADSFKHYILRPLLFTAIGLSIVHSFFLPSELVKAGSGYLPRLDTLYYFFLTSLVVSIVGSITYVAMSYKQAPLREQRRRKWLLFTLMLAIFWGGTPVWLFLFNQDATLLSLIGAVDNAFFLGVLLYSVINHHLADFGSAVSGLFAEVFSLGLLVSLFFGFNALGRNLVAEGQSVSQVLLTVLLLVGAIKAYTPLKKIIRPSTKKWITGTPVDHEILQPHLRYALKRCVTKCDLISVLDNVLHTSLRLDRFALFVRDSDAAYLTDFSGRNNAGKLPVESLRLADAGSPATLIMYDEVDARLAAFLSDIECTALCLLRSGGELIGVLCVGKSEEYATPYYRYDVIRIVELLGVEIPDSIVRIQRFEKAQEELARARKTLSLVDMMNQYHHEIKAPLSIIDGVVSNDLYDQDTRRQLIIDQVARGTELISMMSNVFRENRETQRAELNLVELIKKCVSLFESKFDRVTYDFCEAPAIIGDNDDLSILFINILKNAAEARVDTQPLELTIKTQLDDDQLWVSIRDNGRGMARDHLQRLWDKAYTDKPLGSGIGLQAVKRIADEHLVKIEVSSQLSQGTEFSFGFPLREDDNAGYIQAHWQPQVAGE